ncbi:hypothetical protein AMJ80_03050 [bacterium SM23_31]|nr:MAG: hypothetical protein AMJ80_03050 [bacterium SM23_31]
MAAQKNNAPAAMSRSSARRRKPVLNDEISSLIQAFEYFAESTEKLRESYDLLQEKISALDLELEKKNEQLDLNLRRMDSIRNHLENILESMSMSVVVINLDGNISIFNRAASELTGFTAESVMGKPYTESIGKKIPFESTPLHTLQKGVKHNNKEKEIYSKTGKTIPVEYSTSLVTNAHGEILGAVEMFSDLRKIKVLQEEVQHTRTLAALGEMAGNVAHELRNPLGGIGGFAALLERDLDVDDPRRKLVQKIIEGVARLNSTATNLLVYTRPVRIKKRPENIVQAVDDVLSLVQVELEQDESNIKLKKCYKIDSLEVLIDPELLQQVILNVVKNAVQAMSYEGELEVGITDVKNKDRVEIFVKDSGTGIPEEDIKKLFLPFFTTKADGTGLGLSIAKKIVDAHNGTITVDSSKTGGTIFRISFPY